MDPTLFKSLLYRGESETLDFKSMQYALDNDDEKSKLVKDLLAFVNTSRTADAYILLGVNGSSGGTAQVCGITKNRDDNDFQTLARGKITPPIRFTYESFEYDGKKCGVIKIPVQRRPAYVMKDFGKLREKAVYIRRGSSTDIATPEEIIQMGMIDSGSKMPDFSIRAIPRVMKEGIGHTLWLLTWLKNTGEGTTDEVTVDVSTNKMPGFRPEEWKSERATPPYRYVSQKPLHPLDEVFLMSWRLMHLASETVPGPPVAYNGGPIRATIVVRTKDTKPLTFELKFTKEQICSLEFQQLEPAKNT